MKIQQIIDAVHKYSECFEDALRGNPAPSIHGWGASGTMFEEASLAYQAGTFVNEGLAHLIESDDTFEYEVIKVGTTAPTWTVLQYKVIMDGDNEVERKCLGGDHHWLTEDVALRALMAYEAGRVEHGTAESVVLPFLSLREGMTARPQTLPTDSPSNR